MKNLSLLQLNNIETVTEPFPYFYSNDALKEGFELATHNWLKNSDSWNLVKTDFYEQYEFNLVTSNIPKEFQFLISTEMLSSIEKRFIDIFQIEGLALVGIVAHKLVNGQRIGIHNDYIGGDETHRFVLHFNPEWKEENGGYLMIFNSDSAEDIAQIFQPCNNFAFGFEISAKSHHAVSKILDFARYTIVYTFKKL